MLQIMIGIFKRTIHHTSEPFFAGPKITQKEASDDDDDDVRFQLGSNGVRLINIEIINDQNNQTHPAKPLSKNRVKWKQKVCAHKIQRHFNASLSFQRARSIHQLLSLSPLHRTSLARFRRRLDIRNDSAILETDFEWCSLRRLAFRRYLSRDLDFAARRVADCFLFGAHCFRPSVWCEGRWSIEESVPMYQGADFGSRS